jgi:hypothetical protein
MSVALILSLLAQFGPPAVNLITGLIAKFEASGTVTAAEWAALTASLTLSAKDHAIAQLKAAGIDPASPQGVAFLALVV